MSRLVILSRIYK